MKIYSPILCDVQQDPAVAYCAECGGEIYSKDTTMFLWEGKKICEDCLNDKWDGIKTASERAEYLGAEQVEAGE